MIWHSEKKENVAKELQSPPKKGLTEMIVGIRLEDYGKNTVTERKKKSNFVIFIRRLFSPVSLILILLSAIIVSMVLTSDEINTYYLIDAGIIFVSSIGWAAVSTYREIQADNVILRLKKVTGASAKVLRNKINKTIPVESVVPGDIVRLEAGDIIPADGRLLITTSFSCDESLITGSSEPVFKDSEALLSEETPLEERVNMVYSGTVALSGRALMIVTETGFNTQVGLKYGSNISKINNHTRFVDNAAKVRSVASWIVFLICVSMIVTVLMREGLPPVPQNFGDVKSLLFDSYIYDYAMFALTLAVCAIPFGLPQSTLYSLTESVKKMGADGVLLRKFKKAESIGCTSIICTDKTGTLTLNEMSVAKAWPLGDIPSAVDEGFWSDEMKYLMQCSVLCCDSKVICDDDGNERVVGDRTEAAIISAYMRDGNDINLLLENYPRVAEIPFDSSRKLMTVIHDVNGLYLVVTKGAPDVIVSKCINADVDEINRRNHEFCRDGLRVIAVAVHTLCQLPEKITPKTVENELTFIGLIGMLDPHREGVAEAIEACCRAGIRTVMITGDHPETASSIARRLGIMSKNELAVTGEKLACMSDAKLAKSIDKYSVFARITPDDKVRLVKAWQAKGNCVLMTAGGMGDAPALHSADISCTVEATATDVAADAADITMSENNFVNILSVVKHGRLLRKNIKSLTEYCIMCASSQAILFVLGRLIFGVSMLNLIPVTVLNFLIFWLIQPSFAGEVDNSNIMTQVPEVNDGSPWSFFEAIRSILGGIYVSFASLTAYVIGTGMFNINPSASANEGLTMAFAAMSAGVILQAVCVRSDKPLFRSGLFGNVKLIVGIIITAAATAAMIMIPYVNIVFGFASLNARQWGEIGILAAIQLLIFEYPKLRMYLK